jgi:HEAT repeat protein
MLTNHNPSLAGIVIYCLFVASAMAQNGGSAANSRGKTSAEKLQEYGIELSEPSLLAALSNSTPKVRVLAAMQLAADNDIDAIPAIERAFTYEENPLARVTLAVALESLHEPNGVDHLQAMCADTSLPIEVVFRATQALEVLNIASGGCADALLHSLNQSSDRDYRDSTVSVLPAVYRYVTPDKAEQILEKITNLLSDKTQQPSVRLTAGQALAQVGNPSSVQVIREAVLEETDPVMQASFQDDLHVFETHSDQKGQR